MGFIWNIILSFDNEEFWVDDEQEAREHCEALERINSWIRDGQLVDLTGRTYDDDAGYGMSANLYGGGFKHFDIDGFIKVVSAQRWKERSLVQLWIMGVEEGLGERCFELIDIGDPPPATDSQADKRSSAAKKAASTRKRKSAGKKAARTKQRKAAARNAVATRKSRAGQPKR